MATALDPRFKLNMDGDDAAVGVWDRIKREMMKDSEHEQVRLCNVIEAQTFNVSNSVIKMFGL